MKAMIALVAVTALLVIGCGQPTGYSATNYNLAVYENNTTASVAPLADGLSSRAVVTEFSVGSARTDVFDTLGDPDWIFYGNDQSWDPSVRDADAYHVYSDIGLSFRIFGDTVREITLLSDAWIASNGLIVGMSREQMFEILGSPNNVSYHEPRDFYEYTGYDIMVEVYTATDTVGEINIKEGNLR
jgi:outer membrane protein assembly factor BamE (lipoprotein component of BamABCDE complex)